MNNLDLNYSGCYRMAGKVTGVNKMTGVQFNGCDKTCLSNRAFKHFKQSVYKFQLNWFYYRAVGALNFLELNYCTPKYWLPCHQLQDAFSVTAHRFRNAWRMRNSYNRFRKFSDNLISYFSRISFSVLPFSCVRYLNTKPGQFPLLVNCLTPGNS